jgi:TrmH family RNA methyltransferase
MPVRIVQSKQNARLKELRRAFVRPGRDTHGLVAIEGRHLLDEALRAGLRVARIFIRIPPDERTGVSEPESIDPTGKAEVLMVPAAVFDSIVETETPQPLAAMVEMPDWTWAHVLRPRGAWAPLVAVLAGIQDPGNLGTILRSAEAFGATGIVALPGTVSPWNPKAVRASAGSVFRLPLVTCAVEECFSSLREAGARILTTTGHDGEPADLASLTGPVAVVIGNEGRGVPKAIGARADERITIPCPGPVESLNAAVAASVLLYEASRQRAEESGGAPSLRRTTR